MTTLIICAKAKGTYAMSIDKAAGYADDSHDFIRAKIAGKSYVQIDRLDNTLAGLSEHKIFQQFLLE